MKQILLIILTLILWGCASQPAPEVHTYLLSGPAYEPPAPFDPDAPVLGVAPIELADLLNESGLVMQTSDNQIVHAGQHRWAEPLQSQLESQLYRMLSRSLKDVTVLLAPRRSDATRYELRTRVYRFQGHYDGQAVIEGEWLLLDTQKGQVVMKASFNRRIPIERDGYDALVTRLSEGWHSVMAGIARQLAETLESRQPH
ncbi:ABC-type transport auxiliary lipoprotein family protein [Marinobacteraceae bacterium S3BR75-40.1]